MRNHGTNIDHQPAKEGELQNRRRPEKGRPAERGRVGYSDELGKRSKADYQHLLEEVRRSIPSWLEGTSDIDVTKRDFDQWIAWYSRNNGNGSLEELKDTVGANGGSLMEVDPHES
jgi:hypothetical protein